MAQRRKYRPVLPVPQLAVDLVYRQQTVLAALFIRQTFRLLQQTVCLPQNTHAGHRLTSYRSADQYP